ncbi:MAG: hypothetical protein ABIQ31_22055 [Ferruginibacter sp.]
MNRKNKAIKFLTVFLTIAVISCGQSGVKHEAGETTKKPNPNWKTFTKDNYSVQYPPTWELNETGAMGASFFVFSKPESKDDLFKENVNLLIQDLGGQNIDLDKYVEISESQIKTMITNGSLVESKREKADSREYQKMIYTGDQGTYHLWFEQYYWILKGKAYVLTLTCEKNTVAQFKVTGEAILNSFFFK